jgi:hypothetical protein
LLRTRITSMAIILSCHLLELLAPLALTTACFGY